MRKVIICANQKGGVAKTTTTVNLGIGLAREGKKVLVIDNDPQGSLTEALGYQEPDSLEITLAQIMDWVLNEEPFDIDAGILHHEEGIDLMPANIELSGVETSLVGIMSSETVLKEYIDMIENQYDYIIVDCSPNLGQLTLNALVAADEIIIPVQAAYLPIKGLTIQISGVNSSGRVNAAFCYVVFFKKPVLFATIRIGFCSFQKILYKGGVIGIDQTPSLNASFSAFVDFQQSCFFTIYYLFPEIAFS